MDKERLQVLLRQAIVWIENESSDYFVSSVDDEYEWFEEEIGITKQELHELGIDWLNPKDVEEIDEWDDEDEDEEV